MNEFNESNNGLCTNPYPVKVVLPDLILRVASLTNKVVAVGTSVSVTGTVANTGLIDIAVVAALDYRLSKDRTYGNADDIVMTPVVPNSVYVNPGTMGLGGTYPLTQTVGMLVPANTPGGVYYICGIVDVSAKVSEVNESNNTACSATAYVTIPAH